MRTAYVSPPRTPKRRRKNRPNPKTRQKLSQRFERAVAQASGAVLGGIVGNVPGAAAGAKIAGKFVNYKQGRQRRARRIAARKTGFVGTSSGTYGGKMAPAHGFLPKGWKNLTQSKGYHLTKEFYGGISDANCVYIGHSTWNSDLLTKAITGAILRKLLKKSGIDVPANAAEIQFTDGQSDGMRLRLATINQETGLATYTNVDVANDTTFIQFVDNSPLHTAVSAYLLNQTNETLYSIQLMSLDTSLINTHKQVSTIYFDREYMEIMVEAEMMIQNRTKGQFSAADDNDADRVDNQPLVGYRYTFKHGDPRLRMPKIKINNNTGDTSNVGLGIMPNAGQILIKAVGLPVSYQEPPLPGEWQNCDSSNKVSLQPGEMKKSKISHVYKGMLVSLLHKLRCSTLTSNFWATGIPGKSAHFALEEALRTASTNLVTVNYQNQYTIGAVLTTKRINSPLATTFTAEEVNLL